MPHPDCTCREGVLCIPCFRVLTAGQRPVDVVLAQARPPALGSNDLQQRVHTLCRVLGGWKIHSLARSDRAKTQVGFPDDLLVSEGRLLAAEYKREGELATGDQQAWLQAFWRSNPTVEVYVWWPSEEAAIAACLRDLPPWPRDRQWMTRLPLPCTCVGVA